MFVYIGIAKSKGFTSKQHATGEIYPLQLQRIVEKKIGQNKSLWDAIPAFFLRQPQLTVPGGFDVILINKMWWWCIFARLSMCDATRGIHK